MTPQPDAARPAPGAEPDRAGDVAAGDTSAGDTSAGDTSPVAAPPPGRAIDLERIERDLAGVESALQRLDDGTYWTDEVTGETIADAVLAADPVARRAG